MKLKDRNYILDSEGNILRVVGDVHSSFVTAYVKYYPLDEGMKVFDGKNYMTNTQVFKSYDLLASQPSAIQFNEVYGCVVTGSQKENIIRVFDARDKLIEIFHDRTYDAHPIGKKLRRILSILSEVVDINTLGITGSFLTGMHSVDSDIDLVCYGSDSYKKLCDFFHTTNSIEKYEGKRFIELAKRRMSHMPTLSLDLLRIQENRKLQGLVEGTHFNIQPLRDDGQFQPFADFVFVDIGDIAITGVVVDGAEGVYAPAYYQVSEVSLLEGYSSLDIIKKLTYVISFVGAYSQILQKGESFYAKGTLIRGVKGTEIVYALSIDPWNRGINNKIQLIK